MSTRKILVVDDSKSARYSLRLLLQKYNYEVDTAESAETGLEKIKSDPPHAIFMDHLMPGMNGFEALQMLKGDPRTSHIPVVMCTSNDDEPYQRQAREKGALDILPKPAPPEKLKAILNTIDRIIAQQSGMVEITPAVAVSAPPVVDTRPAVAPPPSTTPERGEILAWVREETHALLAAELRQALDALDKRVEELRKQLADALGAQLDHQLEAGWQRLQSGQGGLSQNDGLLERLEPRLQQLELWLGKQDAEPIQSIVTRVSQELLPRLVEAQAESLEARLLEHMERRLDERTGQLAQELPQNAMVIRRIAELAEAAAQRKATQVVLAKVQDLASASGQETSERTNALLESTQVALRRMYLLAVGAAAVGILAAAGVFLLLKMG